MHDKNPFKSIFLNVKHIGKPKTEQNFQKTVEHKFKSEGKNYDHGKKIVILATVFNAKLRKLL